jgi:hypothetical protein
MLAVVGPSEEIYSEDSVGQAVASCAVPLLGET